MRRVPILLGVGGGSTTCWTVVRRAAAGAQDERQEFARRYLPVLRAYLGARWRNSPMAAEVEDAAQEVFVQCFKEGGALERADPGRAGGFRAFLYGIARNVARQMETKRTRRAAKEAQLGIDEDAIEIDEDGLSTQFDRAWARSVMREAAERQLAVAREKGEAAERRVRLLQLRFQDGLPIRDIARRWGVEPDFLHREYPKARVEFGRAMLEVMAFHHPRPIGEIKRECARLLAILSE